MNTTTTNESAEALCTWNQETDSDRLFSFITRRSEELGELDDDDFELAAI